MKVLILQVSIGTSGYVYSTPGAAADFDRYLIPTVIRYCDKYGYDYQMIKEYPCDLSWFNRSTKPGNFDYSKSGKQKASTLVRYLHMHQPEYDAIVSLDNDIYIPSDAEPLPEIQGHMAVPDLGKTWEGFRKKVKLPNDIFVNAGVQMVDRVTGTQLYSYFKSIVKNKTPPIFGYHSDQGYMNYFRACNLEISHTLGYEWNYMTSCHKPRNIEGKNFVHYAGVEAREYFYEDLKSGELK